MTLTHGYSVFSGWHLTARAVVRSPISIGSLGVAADKVLASHGTASADNSARYLWYKNCGGYTVNSVIVQKKEGGVWYDIEHSEFKGSLGNRDGVCFDLATVGNETPNGIRVPSFDDGDQARLKVSIAEGETVRCDGTNVDTDLDGDTRVLKMEGSTHNNNGCRSQGYRSWGASANQCDADGVKKRDQSC